MDGNFKFKIDESSDFTQPPITNEQIDDVNRAMDESLAEYPASNPEKAAEFEAALHSIYSSNEGGNEDET